MARRSFCWTIRSNRRTLPIGPSGDRCAATGRNYFEWRFRSGHSPAPESLLIVRKGTSEPLAVRRCNPKSEMIEPCCIFLVNHFMSMNPPRTKGLERNALTGKWRLCIVKSLKNRDPDFEAAFFQRQAVYPTPARKAPGLTSREMIILVRGLISCGQTSFF
jgi:hypothetical protein